MADYFKPTGNSGMMMIREYGDIVEFWIRGDNNTNVENVPWAFTVNGRTEWRSLTLDDVSVYQRIHLMTVTYSQTVVFALGDTNTSDLGGPTEFSLYVRRGSDGATVNIIVGQARRRAIPYVKENGVWKLAEPWSKHVGFWKQTT